MRNITSPGARHCNRFSLRELIRRTAEERNSRVVPRDCVSIRTRRVLRAYIASRAEQKNIEDTVKIIITVIYTYHGCIRCSTLRYVGADRDTFGNERNLIITMRQFKLQSLRELHSRTHSGNFV